MRKEKVKQHHLRGWENEWMRKLVAALSGSTKGPHKVVVMILK